MQSRIQVISRKNKAASRLQSMLRRVNKEMYAHNLELAETNQILSLLRDIDKTVLESHDELNIQCEQIAKAIVEKSNYSVVGILANPDDKDYLVPMAISSPKGPSNITSEKGLRADVYDQWMVSPEQSKRYDLTDMAGQKLSPLSTQGHKILAEYLKDQHIKTVIFTKLYARHRLVGLLIIGLVHKNEHITDKEEQLLTRLEETVGIALDNKLLFDENRRVLLKLQQNNKKLKELDQTKDEFISMASHQLRTPLTSVKGYMSMVLEGDAGKLNASQKQLLNQAFVSSQRMVYLIADLLNVSRLKTGKFVIDAHPTNLADVVEGELSQLIETAKAKKLKLEFKKPKDFPELMLDETKIRQVIMNFADNAIYYTPSGGDIKIDLKEDKSNVYFSVRDTGLGVPKDEKAHMFTKFYRGSNARKARPDGTGLGLFMAKKVIDAQGGSILFDSEEGKGSTFGFTFEKHALRTSQPASEQSSKPR